ncbi:MAG: hypothetical protein NPINA01_29640 [Nitrospinaceae bacterium]|nr:MAG: hypothetical protein NPINA01_29640 [Nitrospinaceae bacterium]
MSDWIEDPEATLDASNSIALANRDLKIWILNMGHLSEMRPAQKNAPQTLKKVCCWTKADG